MLSFFLFFPFQEHRSGNTFFPNGKAAQVALLFFWLFQPSTPPDHTAALAHTMSTISKNFPAYILAYTIDNSLLLC